MSSDNGTYVLQTYGPEWRVAQLPAVEDLFEEMDPETGKWSPASKAIVEAYKDSKVFTEFEAAWDAASVLDQTLETEYGTNLIRDFETVKFSDLEAQVKNAK